MRFLVLMAVLVLPSWAVVPLEVADHDLAVTSLAPHVEVLGDPEGRLTLAEVLGPAWAHHWRPESRPVPTFGFTTETLWLRFRVRSTSPRPIGLMVDLATARLSHLRWQVIEGGQLREAFDAGGADVLPAGVPPIRYPLLRLELPAGAERTVVLRVASDTSIWLPLTIAGPAAYHRMEARRAAFILLQLGLCLALAFLTVLQAVMLRQWIYLHLSYLALAYAFYLGGFNGYLSATWPDLPHWIERKGLLIPTALGVLVILRLIARLGNRETMLRREIVAQRCGEAMIWAAVAAFLLLDYRTAARVFNPLVLTGMVAGLGVAVSLFVRRRSRLEASFAVAWLILAGGSLLLVLLFLNLLPFRVEVPLLQSLLLLAVLSSFFLAVAARQRAHQLAELQVERARVAETQARLESLRYQINPHFLFNTLTSIEGLARSEPGRIPLLVSRLATFLRLRLVAKPITSLREELAGTEAYLEIERTRFGEELQVSIEVPADAMACQVPELILQPLAENAIKHGMRPQGGTLIAIRARLEPGRLVVSVENPGSLAPDPRGGTQAGLGLENIRRRLALLYGRHAALSLTARGGVVTASLTLPAQESR